MQKAIGLFVDSAKEFKNLKSVVTAALLVALHTVFAFFLSVQVTDSLRISVSFIVNVVTGCLFGPVMGFVCGGVGDIVQFVLKPVGPYFPGWTLSAALAGLIYGTFFYKKFPEKINSDKKNNSDVSSRGKSVAEIVKLCAGELILCVSLILLVFVPFAEVTGKEDGSVAVSGSAVSIIRSGFDGAGKNTAVVACILIVLVIFLLVANIFRWNAVPLAVTVFCSFAGILAVYTDKKTTTPQWGFWAVILLLVVYMALKTETLAAKHAVDLKFMLRVVLVLLGETLLVNIFLGTYWVSVMYGKGFAFYFTSRLIKNIIQLPINIILTYYVLGFIKNIVRRLGN